MKCAEMFGGILAGLRYQVIKLNFVGTLTSFIDYLFFNIDHYEKFLYIRRIAVPNKFGGIYGIG